MIGDHISEIVTDYVSRVHLSLLEQDAKTYNSVIDISREALAKFPDEVHDTAIESLYDVLVQTGLLGVAVTSDDEESTDPGSQVVLHSVTGTEEHESDPAELQHSAIPSPAASASSSSSASADTSASDIVIKRKKNKAKAARKAKVVKAKARAKANEEKAVEEIDETEFYEPKNAEVVEPAAAAEPEAEVVESVVVEPEPEAEVVEPAVVANAATEPVEETADADRRPSPSIAKKQRDTFLAESLGIQTNRLKYNAATFALIQKDMFEFWQALDKYYNAAVYNTSRFAKEKRGKYAVYMDGRLQKICDSHDRAKNFSHHHTRPFPFGTFIVRIGEEWAVKEPVWIEPSRWCRFQKKLGEQLSQFKEFVCHKANRVGTWFLENPLPVVTVLFLFLAYYVIVNQTERGGEMTVTYRMVEVNDAISSFHDQMAPQKSGTNSRFIDGIKIPGQRGEQMCRYR